MNIANKISMFRIFLVPMFLIFLLADILPLGRHIAIGIFVFASLTDALDGYLARSKNLITNFGKFLDSVADKILICAALVALVELDLLPSWVAIVIISRDFILMTFRMIASASNIVIASDKMGKIKTILQMIMIIHLMLMINTPFMELVGNFLIGMVVFLTIASCINYIIKNVSILGLEKI